MVMRTATEGGRGCIGERREVGICTDHRREVEMCIELKKKWGFLPFTGARKGCEEAKKRGGDAYSYKIYVEMCTGKEESRDVYN